MEQLKPPPRGTRGCPRPAARRLRSPRGRRGTSMPVRPLRRRKHKTTLLRLKASTSATLALAKASRVNSTARRRSPRADTHRSSLDHFRRRKASPPPPPTAVPRLTRARQRRQPPRRAPPQCEQAFISKTPCSASARPARFPCTTTVEDRRERRSENRACPRARRAGRGRGSSSR